MGQDSSDSFVSFSLVVFHAVTRDRRSMGGPYDVDEPGLDTPHLTWGWAESLRDCVPALPEFFTREDRRDASRGTGDHQLVFGGEWRDLFLCVDHPPQ